MNILDLQAELKATGRYAGALDGRWGRLTESAILLAMSDGPDTSATPGDFAAAGHAMGIAAEAIHAFWIVEASGAAFQDGRPKILPERHYFSKLTSGRFDRSYPKVSYPKWGTLPYPATQDDRYDLLLAMVCLDVDAGFASCSYGAPQIMGANYRMCGYASSFAFAAAMARDEATQLRAFASFITATGIVNYLRRVNRSTDTWSEVAKRYNGPAFQKNDYATKLRDAYVMIGGK